MSHGNGYVVLPTMLGIVRVPFLRAPCFVHFFDLILNTKGPQTNFYIFSPPFLQHAVTSRFNLNRTNHHPKWVDTVTTTRPTATTGAIWSSWWQERDGKNQIFWWCISCSYNWCVGCHHSALVRATETKIQTPNKAQIPVIYIRSYFKIVNSHNLDYHNFHSISSMHRDHPAYSPREVAGLSHPSAHRHKGLNDPCARWESDLKRSILSIFSIYSPTSSHHLTQLLTNLLYHPRLHLIPNLNQTPVWNIVEYTQIEELQNNIRDNCIIYSLKNTRVVTCILARTDPTGTQHNDK